MISSRNGNAQGLTAQTGKPRVLGFSTKGADEMGNMNRGNFAFAETRELLPRGGFGGTAWDCSVGGELGEPCQKEQSREHW